MRKGTPAMPLVFLAFLTLLTGCGGQNGGETDTEFYVNLTALCAEMEASCGWEPDYMTDLEGEMLESYYPGLSGLTAVQLTARTPAMSSDVNEIVLMQCETEEEAQSAAQMLQARVDSQLEGGAWYAETRAAWEKAAVFQEGLYAALIASGEFQHTLEEQFRQAFS